jgi:hypothetical protein
MGPQGLKGDKGDIGEAGAPGTAGSISQTIIVNNSVTITPPPYMWPGTTIPVTVSCPNGKTLISGGGQVTSSVSTPATHTAPIVALTESYPLDAITWKVVGSLITGANSGNNGMNDDSITVTVHALCAE